MVGAIVVAAIGGNHRQAICVVPGAHQVVAGRFAGAVGTVRFDVIGFGKSWVVFAKRSIDFIS